MRVPEISLGYGLLAQNKHDLCRYYKYTERHKQTQYLPAYTVSFMVVPSVRAWEFRVSEMSEYLDISQHIRVFPSVHNTSERFGNTYVCKLALDGRARRMGAGEPHPLPSKYFSFYFACPCLLESLYAHMMHGSRRKIFLIIRTIFPAPIRER